MSHFMDRKGEQQNDERDENLREVDVWQRITLTVENTVTADAVYRARQGLATG
jgi:hypothetical protein